jgi:hypothetical protein
MDCDQLNPEKARESSGHDDSVVLVTGAARGMGRAGAARFAIFSGAAAIEAT